MSAYTPDGIASAFIAEGRRRGISPRGIVICLATGLVESNLTVYANPKVPESLNLPHDDVGSDGFSVGALQQQVISSNGVWWWGDAKTCMDPTSSSGLFYERLARLDYNSDARTPGSYAQDIQRSGFGDRYDPRMPAAQKLYDRLAADSPVDGGSHEHILPYDHSRALVTQETPFWCGPAASQIVLNGCGIDRAEADLARELGTTTDGTGSIGQIAPVLQRETGVPWTSRSLPAEPITAAQREQLWTDVRRGIDGGHGLVVNWVAPPGNFPRGVKGSVSPNYAERAGGQTIFHYVALMGYDDGDRSVWIADSGFQPQGYWLAFDQLCTLIPPKGYCFADVAPTDQVADLAKSTPWLGDRVDAESGTCPDGRGRFAKFTGGYVYWSPTTGAHAIPSRLFDSYTRYGWEAGPLGYPTAERTELPDGLAQAFEHGVLYRRADSDIGFYVTGAILTRWAGAGFEQGPLGWPMSNEAAQPDGARRQDFQHGAIYWSPDGCVTIPA